MPLESANNISQLDDRYPLASDPASRGDDHLRLLKGVLKKQFPGKDGNGLAAPITLTEEFLNGLPKKLEDMQKSIDARWPVGSALLLFSNQNPNGTYPGTWALVTGDASLALGDGSSNVGGIFGDNTPLVPLPEHGHIGHFNGNPLPPHDHGMQIFGDVQAGNVNQRAPAIAKNQGELRTQGNSAGTPTGSVTVDVNGTRDARINVRGAQIKVNVWKRTA